MLLLFALSGFFCFLIFFCDLLLDWDKKITVQVSIENLSSFKKIDQSFFEFEAFDSPNGSIQLLKEDGTWSLKNGELLSSGLKKELMKLCMEKEGYHFEEDQFSLKNQILVLFSALTIFLNSCVLLMDRDIRCFCLEKKVKQQSKLLTLICRIFLLNFFTCLMIGICILVRNSYDSGKGWLLSMRKYDLIEQTYTSFKLFYHDYAGNMVAAGILILIFCMLLSLSVQKICCAAEDKKEVVQMLTGMIFFLYLLNEIGIFQNNFPDFIEYMPLIGPVFILKEICRGTCLFYNAMFSILIQTLFILIL